MRFLKDMDEKVEDWSWWDWRPKSKREGGVGVEGGDWVD